jgi:hypothetical protein
VSVEIRELVIQARVLDEQAYRTPMRDAGPEVDDRLIEAVARRVLEVLRETRTEWDL